MAIVLNTLEYYFEVKMKLNCRKLSSLIRCDSIEAAVSILGIMESNPSTF